MLLTVEERFLISRWGGLVLVPELVDLTTSRPLKVPIEDRCPDYPRLPSPRPTEVELRLPDGTTRTAACKFWQVHHNYADIQSDAPPGYKPTLVWSCVLMSLSNADVPPGTEVWYDTDS